MTSEGPPPVESRGRIPMRIVAIVGAYLLYRVLEARHAAGAAFTGAGVGLLALMLIDRYTLWRHKPLGLLQVGATILGLGLLGIGLYLVAR